MESFLVFQSLPLLKDSPYQRYKIHLVFIIIKCNPSINDIFIESPDPSNPNSRDLSLGGVFADGDFEKLGIRQNMISDYERGRRRLSSSMAKQMAKALHIKVDRLSYVRTSHFTRPVKKLNRVIRIKSISDFGLLFDLDIQSPFSYTSSHKKRILLNIAL